MAKSKVISTKAELAAAYGWSSKTVNELTKRHEFPGGRNGPWETSKVDTWNFGRGSRRRAGSKSRMPGSRKTAKEKAEAARAERRDVVADRQQELRLEAEEQKVRRARLFNDRAEGKVCDKAAVESWASFLLTEVREGYMRLSAHTSVLIPDEHRELVRATIDKAARDQLAILQKRLSEPPC